MAVAREAIAGVVLAAGAGTRLRPLTLEKPKALCPVGNAPLVDWALARIEPHVAQRAVNVHGTAPALLTYVSDRAHPSVEHDERLGTAGALGRLRGWIAGRAVLVHNADSFVDDDLVGLLAGWDGERPRLLVRTGDVASDFGTRRFLGVSLLPASVALTLPATPCGLYPLVWKPAFDVGELEFVEARGTAIDCGTAADYLRANLHVSGGASVVAPDAVVEGSITRCVVWPGAQVRADEVLVDTIRTPRHTVSGVAPAAPA
jgi:NDP-sugar pyrophosphorylase family protein